MSSVLVSRSRHRQTIEWHRNNKVTTYGGFQWANPRKRDHLEDLGVDGRLTLKWIFEVKDGGVD